MNKICTSLEQAKKLIELRLNINTADMHYVLIDTDKYDAGLGKYIGVLPHYPCWSLAALLKYLSEIMPQVYTPVLFPSEDKWILQFVGYGHGNVCEVSYDNPIDACCEMIVKLKML